jgi:serine protease Do
MPEETPDKKGPGSKSESAWGITAQNLTPELAQKFGVDEKEAGVIITELTAGTQAAEARLRPGDIIKEVNRQKIQNVRDWKQTTEKMKKGETLLLLVKRGANTFYVAIKAGKE